ncbi:MAG TPA: hypothetical protein VNA69_01540 [Thermoanaerobaculia bacterium]|nr:hypothetical protein [Thermoanaerobaculia bacterium]
MALLVSALVLIGSVPERTEGHGFEIIFKEPTIRSFVLLSKDVSVASSQPDVDSDFVKAYSSYDVVINRKSREQWESNALARQDYLIRPRHVNAHERQIRYRHANWNLLLRAMEASAKSRRLTGICQPKRHSSTLPILKRHVGNFSYADPRALFQSQRVARGLYAALARLRDTLGIGSVRASGVGRAGGCWHKFTQSLGLIFRNAKSAIGSALLPYRGALRIRHLLFREFYLLVDVPSPSESRQEQQAIKAGLQKIERWEPKYPAFLAALWFGCAACLCIGFFFWLVLWGSGRIGRSSIIWGLLILIVAVAVTLHAARLTS